MPQVGGDGVFAGSESGRRREVGVRFVAVGGNPSGGENTSYVVGAAPEVFDRTGKRMFCSTDKNVIRADLNSGGSTTPPAAEQCAEFAALR